MQLYAAIYLHSNNSMAVVIDGDARIALARRLPGEFSGAAIAARGPRIGVRGHPDTRSEDAIRTAVRTVTGRAANLDRT